jgi:hypothetical protein
LLIECRETCAGFAEQPGAGLGGSISRHLARQRVRPLHLVQAFGALSSSSAS